MIVRVALIAAVASMSPRLAQAYTNSDFGFSLQIPPGLTVCGEQPPAPNDGVSVLLRSQDCTKEDGVSRVNVWA